MGENLEAELKRQLEEAQQKIKELENTQTKSFNSWPKLEKLGMSLAVSAALVPVVALAVKAVKELNRTHTVVGPKAKDLLYDYAEAKAKEERQLEMDMRAHEIMSEVEHNSPADLAERYAKSLRDEQERAHEQRAQSKIVKAVVKATSGETNEV